MAVLSDFLEIILLTVIAVDLLSYVRNINNMVYF